jgi:glycine/D-amino acid oxidase-like deaminating enzyme
MDVAVVGGGITGLFAARYLRAAGAEVTLYERTRLGAGSVHAAGILEGHNYYCINNLRYLRRAFRYLRSGASGFRSVDGRWLRGYVRHFGRTLAPEDLAGTAALGSRSLAEYSAMAEERNDFGFAMGGLTEYYSVRRNFRDALETVRAREMDERVEVEEKPDGTGSLHYPNMGWIDTDLFVARMEREIHGTKVVTGEVGRVTLDGEVTCGAEKKRHDAVILTGGIACRRMGLPITSVKGYGWKIRTKTPLKNAVIYADYGIAAVPLADGGKLTGGWDFSLSGSAARSEKVLRIARTLLELTEVGPVQMGHRPSSPDGLPIVGQKGKVVVATGGFRLGWSFAPGMARLATDLCLGQAPPDPFLGRFVRGLREGDLSGAFSQSA